MIIAAELSKILIFIILKFAVIFWELTSHLSPFNYETRNDHTSLMLDTIDGLREEPVQNTNLLSFIENVGNTNQINGQIFIK
ncbi:kinase-like domain-containing protein [Rhizophagus clarus]|uniref:Kinase-like domain-containing protein n=1 Tax=Rhizophagus clarus TaxID=94130 RepID=A0A8H3QBD1_9GLOM|nr:kinase-like domain-containing protein [Rhizophagus clarus]